MRNAVTNNVSVAILWHFHQPIYSKPDDCTYPLPWVRLHCIKDYLDMLKHVQKFPDLHVTFNFTPSLLLQIDDYKNNRCTDRQFNLFKKKAEDLTIDEKVEILQDFFLANWTYMVEKNRRYFSLLLKRGKNIVEKELPGIALSFTPEEFRDLQIWANLAWIDPMFRHEIEDLYKKGKNFKEEDKDRVITLENNIIGSVIDEYKKALESGQIEISTSPLYHPILPLLINSNLAKVSNPNLAIPFDISYVEDAKKQIAEGIAVFEKFFGQKPKGLWPSEGSVCKELIPILSEFDIKWIASDEEILARSLETSFRRENTVIPNRPDLLYKPWKMGNINIVFRDHILSDLIGFVYSQWDQKQAANDLMGRLESIASTLPTFDKFIIPIILDGENAWESYDNDGTEFLDTFYDNLMRNNIQTTTISKFIEENEVKNELIDLFPGSWIGANFNIWMGHVEDHKAWLIVKKIREKLVEKNISDPDIWDRLYILEGSDWYWWFGGEHISLVADVFDELFRLNAIWIYKKINEEPPPELFSPIKKTTEILTYQPNDKMTPEIDGKVTHYYEWYHAGHITVKRMGGTMQRFAGLFSMIYCGFDDDNLYIRLDIANHNPADYEYIIKFYKPKEITIQIGKQPEIESKIKKIVELAIPASFVHVVGEPNVEFTVTAQQNGVEIDRTPLLKFTVKLRDVKLYNWSV
jgi:alpha-amylase/alpha-mannosidase (GH57 family)